ncbi:hypothetical protein [Couchioplanes caeruleus]|uniref:Uncharacterized protein n=2 Tax=Couchioplanes caeruleus TaxID=56438 RepID=A0A1K0FC65_9ACTN|nr:hypothetical protein [Couchioplanes caeruleus]OJF10336.1 hypothetical protein BG844_32335 [Couchioplanes caeruleus subsp. caeruleus]ROP32272.1 hypothetical protein EDD30_5208 [Couchioplanes caeruleus]
MTVQWRHLPAAARPIAAATAAAAMAARDQDRDALTEAVALLSTQDQTQTGLILGTAVRLQLEAAHPDGLDADDVRAVLEKSVRPAAAWCPEVDPQVMLYLLAGALGVWDDDGSPPPAPGALALHAALLLTHLSGARPIAEVITAALGEIQHAQLND